MKLMNAPASYHMEYLYMYFSTISLKRGVLLYTSLCNLDTTVYVAQLLRELYFLETNLK